MMSNELNLLMKHYTQKNSLKFAEQLLKSVRLKRPIVVELLAQSDQNLLSFTKDAIDEFKQNQQGFIFLAGCNDKLKISKTKNSPVIRLKQINTDLNAEEKWTLIKYWPVFDKSFYEKLILQKMGILEGQGIFVATDAKKIINKIESILDSDYQILCALNEVIPVTPVPRKRNL